jgi:hypothetical protein
VTIAMLNMTLLVLFILYCPLLNVPTSMYISGHHYKFWPTSPLATTTTAPAHDEKTK